MIKSAESLFSQLTEKREYVNNILLPGIVLAATGHLAAEKKEEIHQSIVTMFGLKRESEVVNTGVGARAKDIKIPERECGFTMIELRRENGDVSHITAEKRITNWLQKQYIRVTGNKRKGWRC